MDDAKTKHINVLAIAGALMLACSIEHLHILTLPEPPSPVHYTILYGIQDVCTIVAAVTYPGKRGKILYSVFIVILSILFIIYLIACLKP